VLPPGTPGIEGIDILIESEASGWMGKFTNSASVFRNDEEEFKKNPG
jgi:hypothetical protein